MKINIVGPIPNVSKLRVHHLANKLSFSASICVRSSVHISTLVFSVCEFCFPKLTTLKKSTDLNKNPCILITIAYDQAKFSTQ